MIELFSTVDKAAPLYARKPFVIAVGDTVQVPTTYIKADAKQFKTVKQAHAWLARWEFTGYLSTDMPWPFTGFRLLSLDTTEA